MIDITIPLRTPTFNQLLRMHFRRRRKVLKEIAWEVRRLGGVPPPEPLARARVTIHRYTTGTLDEDGLPAVAKGILDVLQPCSLKHPLGLGWIASDGPACLELQVLVVKSEAKATRIIVEAR